MLRPSRSSFWPLQISLQCLGKEQRKGATVFIFIQVFLFQIMKYALQGLEYGFMIDEGR